MTVKRFRGLALAVSHGYHLLSPTMGYTSCSHFKSSLLCNPHHGYYSPHFTKKLTSEWLSYLLKATQLLFGRAKEWNSSVWHSKALNGNSIFPHATEAIEQNLKGKQMHAYLLAKILTRPA